MRPLVAVVLCVFLLPLVTQAQTPALSVNEEHIRAHSSNSSVDLEFPVLLAGSPRTADLRAELISSEEKLLAGAQRSVTLPEGKSSQKLSVALPEKFDTDKLLWLRVRYSITAAGQSRSGVVALGAIQPDLFEMRVAYPEKAQIGKRYRVRVMTANPVTQVRLAGVRLTATMSSDDDVDGKSQTLHATTGADGEANLTFVMPRDPTSEPEIQVVASNGRQEHSESFDVHFAVPWEIITSTDKELYQPGQELHVRALCLNAEKHAYPKLSLRFTLKDPEDNVVLRDATETNEYGIATLDWRLPESLRLGEYSLVVNQAAASLEDDSEPIAISSVKISRYDLPNFSVTAQPDRPYYLPQQNATVKIGAQYLFGKPLLHGAVRIVREEHRHWDFTSQKWEVDESAEVHGELDDKGNYEFKAELAEEFHDLADETYTRYRDVHYAAYITDKTTGKTEQRRFNLRLSHQRVHMYITRQEFAGGQTNFYVATYLPDGSPARCNVQLSEITEDENHERSERLVRMFTTNKYGVAKVSNLELTRQSDHSLKFVIIDPEGAWTTHMEDMWFGGANGEGTGFAVSTDHALYKPGQAIYAEVRASRDASSLTLDVMQNGSVLRTYAVHLRNGHASLVIPYAPDLKGQVTLVAYNLLADFTYRWDLPFGAHTVLYPEDRTLKVDAHLSKASYRPGEDAELAVRVSDRDGTGAQSALGVVVLDKAVEERIRSDQEFGHSGRYGFWDWGWWYNADNYGGITYQDLVSYDVEQGVPKELDEVAEVLLNSSVAMDVPEIEGNSYRASEHEKFNTAMGASLRPLTSWIEKAVPYPRSLSELKAEAAKHGVAIESVVDPWGQPYRYTFGLSYNNYTVTATSAGPDKKFGTPDDLTWSDFRQSIFYEYSGRFRDAVFALETKHSIKGADPEEFKRALATEGFDIARILDPWGHSYDVKLTVYGPNLAVRVMSQGPPAEKGSRSYEVMAWNWSVDYFAPDRSKIDEALDRARRSGIPFPKNLAEFDADLKLAGLSRENFRDPWGRPYDVSFREWSQYSDSVRIYGGNTGQTQASTPVTVQLLGITLTSAGTDGKPGTGDDFVVGQFSLARDEQVGSSPTPVKVDGVVLNPYSGAIRGTVTDPSGAVVPGATVTAHRVSEDAPQWKATTDSSGRFLLKNLPSGMYIVNISALGFVSWSSPYVPVRSASATEIDARLNVGSTAQTVEVTAEANSVATESSSVAQVKSNGVAKLENFTPRLREYFPETLLWRPSVVTHRDGSSKVQFKLADNITTWKLSLLASDKNGRVGYLQKEIQAFQPFFVEHDPPKVLTVGDELQLPVTVRNYLQKSQTVAVTMKPESWFKLLAEGEQEISVPAGDSTNAIFDVQASEFTRDGKQRVTAANHTLGDAIEKPVSVHPDGREETASASRILTTEDSFDYDLPGEIVPASLRAEVRLYPNLVAHAVEAIEAGLERPYGCGEQTISSTYPSLLVLEYLGKHPGTDRAIVTKARRYLEQGYRRLLNYRSDDGGFTYWGRGESDPALTAYAVRFLREASQFIKVDEELVPDAELWLVRSQKGDSWIPRYGYADNVTAYIALTLSASQADERNNKVVAEAIGKAMARLGAAADKFEDPYGIATVGMLALRLGERSTAERAAEMLRKKALHQGQGVYWELVQNTPFYGWGHAGAIETTALAVRFLRELKDGAADENLIGGGLTYLVNNKDRYGVWYSGQATQQVLGTILELLDTGNVAGTYEISVNGKAAAEINVPSDQVAPSYIDVSKYLAGGKNKVVVHRKEAGAGASLQLSADYYVPWKGEGSEAVRTGEVRGLKLKVEFDKHEVRVGEPIHCKVHAERFGSRGWGMMLAEIGVPPGVDVGRSSLEAAIQTSNLDQYDVLPDRVVLYLWPGAGGANVDFSFKPRMGMRALNSQSRLYDYYNPEEEVIVAPERFVVTAPVDRQVAVSRTH